MQHGSRASGAVLFAALGLALGSCTTVPNVSLPPIPVPQELSENDVELAIVLAIAGGAVPANLTPGQEITDEALGAIFRRYEGVRNKWFLEDRDPGVVLVGFQHRRYYMRIAAAYTQDAVTLSIVYSRNLSQSDGRIHRQAHAWLERLEIRIRQSLGEVLQRNLSGSAKDLSAIRRFAFGYA